MESHESRRSFFTPVSRAFADTWLQLRSTPLIFLLIWLTLALAPQLLMSFAFQKPISEMMDMSFELISTTLTTGGEDFFVSDEMSDVIFKGFRAMIIMMILLALAAVYLGSVLAGVVGRFRGMFRPTFSGAFADGLSRFPGLLKAILVAAYRALTRPVVVFIIGAVVGTLLNQPALIYFFFIVSSILFLMGILRYGLGPFIHLSLGISGRDSALVSKTYYMSHRPVVSLLFMFVILLPMVLISFMMNLLISLGMFSGAGGMILGIIQSVVQTSMTIVLINFAMNNFLSQEWGVGDSPDNA